MKTRAIEIINTATVWINETEHEIIEVSVIPGEYSNKNDLNFTWYVTDITEDKMEIKLDFENPSVVSFRQSREILSVKFWGQYYFQDNNGYPIWPNEEFLMEIPPQTD